MSSTLILKVTGMTCGGCENAVKRAVARVDGVTSVTASHKDGRVEVVADPARVTRGAVARAITAIGYEVAEA